MADPRKLQDEALAAIATGDWNGAAAIYMALERLRPTDGTWALKLGECQRRLGNNDEAVKALTRALQVYARQDLRSKAVAVCKLILEIEPRNRDVREVMAWLSDPKREASATAETEVAAGAHGDGAEARETGEFAVPASFRKAERAERSEAAAPAAEVQAPAAEAKRLVLPKTPFFAALSREQLRRVNQRAHLVEVEMGEILFAHGDAADALYLVAAGHIAVLAPQEVLRLGRGDFFGEEVAVLPGQPRMATMRAVEPSQVLILDRDLVAELLAGAPALLDVLVASLRERLLCLLARTSPMLAPLPEAERQALLARFRLIEVDKHGQILEPGQAGAGLHVLLAGEAVASIEGRSLERMQPGEVFGEIPLVTGRRILLTVMAREKSLVLHLPRADFEAVRATYPQVLEYLTALAETRLGQLGRTVEPPPGLQAVRAAVSSRPRLLLAHGAPELLEAYERGFGDAGFEVEAVADGKAATDSLSRASFDVVVCSAELPGGRGVEFLRSVRRSDLDVPVILTTANPGLNTALAAINFGVVQGFLDPTPLPALLAAAQKAVHFHRLTRLRREALGKLHSSPEWMGDHAGLELHFGSALGNLWMAFQPIVSASAQGVFAFEALLRSSERTLPSAASVLRAAERLHRVHELGRLTRDSVAATAAHGPGEPLMFINLHGEDLLDDHLLDPHAKLSRIAPRVILEITERRPLDELGDLRARVAILRSLGFRIAIDNLGSGHVGLATLAQLEPEVAKLDLSLVRGIDGDAVKQALVGEMLRVCRDMGVQVICEGVETVQERDALVELGADLMQGFLFARPGPPFPAVPRATLPRRK